MPIRSILPDFKVFEVSNLIDYVFDDAVNPSPDTTIMVDPDTGTRWSFGQFKDNVAMVARALHAFGIRKGDVVAMCLPNCMELISTIIAAISRGIIVCGLNPNYTHEEYQYHLTDCSPKLVFVSQESARNVSQAVKNMKGNQKIIFVEDPTGAPSSGALAYREFLRGASIVKDLPSVVLDPKVDIAFMLYSSGTTGKPKGVLLSHHAWCKGMQLTYTPKAHDCAKPGESVIGMMPIFHLMGLMVAMHAVRHGVQYVLMRKYDPERFLFLIQEYKPRVLNCVPPMVILFAKSPLVNKYDLNSLRTLLPGAAPMGKELHDEVMARLPYLDNVCQGYGLTETGSAVTFTPPWAVRPGSCGLLLPQYTCKVIDVETGKECGPNQSGEVCFQGPSFMSRYHNNPKATDDTIDKDGWLHTGDIGYYDEDGYFFIVDRLKELIKVKGFQVSPAELEDLLLSHPAVQDVAVISKPDPLAGEVPKAMVVKKPSVQATAAELIQFVSEHVTSYKRLKGGVEFVDSIPKSPSGKILRRLLQQREKERNATSKL